MTSGSAYAHKASDAFIDLHETGTDSELAVRWDIAIRDLDTLLDLDTDGDGVVRWSDVVNRSAQLEAQALAAITFDRDGRICQAKSAALSLATRSDGAYVALRFRLDCPSITPRPADIGIRYRLLADIDPTHRAIVSVDNGGLQTLRPTDERSSFIVSGPEAGYGAQIAGFLNAGFLHILYGPDHLAFLLALLIAALAVPANIGSRRILLGLLTTVSVFTVAHSITLALSAMSWIHVPSRWVEAAVALSVTIAGLQAFTAAQFGYRSRYAVVPLWLIFSFGLVHGIGFGSSLAESGFGGRSAVTALLGFNLGVELGQVAALSAVLPLAWILVASRHLRHWGLPLAALAISAFGATWFAERLMA